AGPWQCTVNDRWVLIAGTWAYLGSCPLPVGMEADCLNGNGALGSKRPVGGGSGIHRKGDAATQLLRELPYMRLLYDGIMVAVHQVDVQPCTGQFAPAHVLGSRACFGPDQGELAGEHRRDVLLNGLGVGIDDVEVPQFGRERMAL